MDDPLLATNQNYPPLYFFSIIRGIDLFVKIIILQDLFFFFNLWNSIKQKKVILIMLLKFKIFW